MREVVERKRLNNVSNIPRLRIRKNRLWLCWSFALAMSYLTLQSVKGVTVEGLLDWTSSHILNRAYQSNWFEWGLQLQQNFQLIDEDNRIILLHSANFIKVDLVKLYLLHLAFFRCTVEYGPWINTTCRYALFLSHHLQHFTYLPNSGTYLRQRNGFIALISKTFECHPEGLFTQFWLGWHKWTKVDKSEYKKFPELGGTDLESELCNDYHCHGWLSEFRAMRNDNSRKLS